MYDGSNLLQIDSDKKQFMQKEKVFIQIYARILFIDRDNGAC